MAFGVNPAYPKGNHLMTLTVPSTGGGFKAAGLNNYRSNRVRRGGLVAVLHRDYGGAATNISPTVFNPFAQDGNIRTDLLAVVKDADGNFVPNPQPNQGWYLGGALDPKGVDQTPEMTVDKLEILQANMEIRSDIQKEGGTVNYTLFESRGLTDALRYNRPLNSIPQDGQFQYFYGKYSDATLVERQLLLIRADQASGAPEFTAVPVPRCTLNKINARKWDKKNPDALDLVWDKLLDEYFIDIDGTPLQDGVWRSGSGWGAAGGAPEEDSVTVTATAVTGLKATVAFPVPGGADGPFTYTMNQKAGSGSLVPSTLLGLPSVSGGVVTLTATTLTAGTSYVFQPVVQGDNMVSTTLPLSNSVIAIA
jgi:hypothetical protein